MTIGARTIGARTIGALTRSLLAVALTAALLLAPGCSSPARAPGQGDDPHPPATVDYRALESQIDDSITSGSLTLDNVRAVLVTVDGSTEIAHYRHGFTATDHEHVWSVTKSVVSTLIGIAVGEGLIRDLDQPLAELLPDQRRDMRPAVARVTLRELMTMSGGFSDPPQPTVDAVLAGRLDLVRWALTEGQQEAGGREFRYSNTDADLVAAVLAAALRRNPATRNQTVLDYARTRLFDPLGIETRDPYEGVPEDAADSAWARSGFAWSTVGGHFLGAFGLRLSAEDLTKLGQLYADDGVWQGRRLLPAGWVAQATAPSRLQPTYGLLWWRDTQAGLALIEAKGSSGQRVVVVPERRAVVVILCTTTGVEHPMGDEDVDPLIDNVIVPALR